ncbi:MAG: hypothetical protein Q8R28_23230 [Dehalococcoidia bacterium]|nr:hypothetical protein [Dehalococcoidia bacterium]
MFTGGLGGMGGGGSATGGQQGGGRKPGGGSGLDFDLHTILTIMSSFLMASPMLQGLRNFRTEVEVVRRHLILAVTEIGAAGGHTKEELKAMGVVTLMGLVLSHWVEMVTGSRPGARQPDKYDDNDHEDSGMGEDGDL